MGEAGRARLQSLDLRLHLCIMEICLPQGSKNHKFLIWLLDSGLSPIG